MIKKEVIRNIRRFFIECALAYLLLELTPLGVIAQDLSIYSWWWVGLAFVSHLGAGIRRIIEIRNKFPKKEEHYE